MHTNKTTSTGKKATLTEHLLQHALWRHFLTLSICFLSLEIKRYYEPYPIRFGFFCVPVFCLCAIIFYRHWMIVDGTHSHTRQSVIMKNVIFSNFMPFMYSLYRCLAPSLSPLFIIVIQLLYLRRYICLFESFDVFLLWMSSSQTTLSWCNSIVIFYCQKLKFLIIIISAVFSMLEIALLQYALSFLMLVKSRMRNASNTDTVVPYASHTPSIPPPFLVRYQNDINRTRRR